MVEDGPFVRRTNNVDDKVCEATLLSSEWSIPLTFWPRDDKLYVGRWLYGKGALFLNGKYWCNKFYYDDEIEKRTQSYILLLESSSRIGEMLP